MADTQGKTLLVTGATGGMGRATSLAGAAQGYDLLLADLFEDRLASLAGECRAAGVAATTVRLDVTAPETVQALLGAAAGGLDAIVHTVGVSPAMAGWEQIIAIDLIGSVALLEQLRPLLNPGGCAVCIASMSAYMLPPNEDVETLLADPLAPDLLERAAQLPGTPLGESAAAYPYAKKALIHYVEANAGAWGSEQKRLVTISPGLIDTDMGRLEGSKDDGQAFAAMEPLISLQRHGDPQEIAEVALFLASPQASYITGCDLLVDGGFVGTMRTVQRQQAGQ